MRFSRSGDCPMDINGLKKVGVVKYDRGELARLIH